jgi:serine/threonine protein kinase
MGEVYRARDTRLDREVAIKVLPEFLCFDPDRLRRFEQEARAAAALNHSNILAVHQMGTYEGIPYLVSSSWKARRYARVSDSGGGKSMNLQRCIKSHGQRSAIEKGIGISPMPQCPDWIGRTVTATPHTEPQRRTQPPYPPSWNRRCWDRSE